MSDQEKHTGLYRAKWMRVKNGELIPGGVYYVLGDTIMGALCRVRRWLDEKEKVVGWEYEVVSIKLYSDSVALIGDG
jgi:Uri superfamily endonuclease